MAAEASAFLVKEKLQSLVDGGGIVFPGLEGKISDAIGKLKKLSQRSGDGFPEVLTSMQCLEDAIGKLEKLLQRSRDGFPQVVEDVIGKLEKLLQRSRDGSQQVLTSMHGLEDAIGKLEKLSQRSGDGSQTFMHGLKDGIGKLKKLSQRMRQVLTSMHGLEDVLDTYFIKRQHEDASSSSTNYFHLWSQMQLSQAINKFLNKVRNVKAPVDDDVCGPASYYSLTDQARSTWDGVFRYQQGMEMTQGVKELVSYLIDPEDRDLVVLPVLNPRGHEKTVVVRSAYDSLQVKRHFQFRAWVYIDSQDNDFRHILIDLIHQGTMSQSTDIDHIEEAALQDMLFKMLMEKTYLIVFINVCNREAWTQLAVTLPNCHNGSRVVLTTPNLEVANFVDPLNPPFNLKPLTCEESWLLLLKHVRKDDQNQSPYDHLKEIVMQKFKGIFMAIRLLGGVLYNKQLSEWEGVMDDYVVGDMKEEDDEEARVVSNMLAFSFHLLHPVLKGCLLYMVLFPKELDIPVRRLLHLWLAEGFFNSQKILPEDAAKMCLEELINRKLIEVTNWTLDGSPKTCCMPPLIRDFLQDGNNNNNSVQAGLVDIYGESGSQRRVATESQKLISRRFVEHSSHGRNTTTDNSALDQTNTTLHSYLCFNTHTRGSANTDIGNFLKVFLRKKSFSLLRVLDLEGVYMPELPNAIGTLVLLKFLGLRLTVLNSIPESISTLPLLETLDLKHTNVNVIPSSIWKSKSLRHLYVNEVRLSGSIRKASGGPLPNFQTIRGIYIVDEMVVSNVLERFVNLRKVGITCHKDSIDQVSKWISERSQLQTLKLRSLDDLGKPSNLSAELKFDKNKILKLYLLGKVENSLHLVSSLPRCLRKLTLSSSEIEGNDSIEILGDLPELVILRLLANSYKSPEMTCSSGKFPKLRGLKLWMLRELEVWKVEKGAMPYLEELEIRKCDKIKIIDGLEHLTRLDELVLTSMPENLAKYVKKSCGRSNICIKENSWKFSYYYY